MFAFWTQFSFIQISWMASHFRDKACHFISGSSLHSNSSAHAYTVFTVFPLPRSLSDSPSSPVAPDPAPAPLCRMLFFIGSLQFICIEISLSPPRFTAAVTRSGIAVWYASHDWMNVAQESDKNPMDMNKYSWKRIWNYEDVPQETTLKRNPE